MDIIKGGIPPAERMWLGTCPSCKSEIRAKVSDLLQVAYDQREGVKFGRAKCPVCRCALLFYPKEE